MFMIHKHYEQRSFRTLTRRGVTPVRATPPIVRDIMPDNDATPCAQPDTPTPLSLFSAHWKVLVLLGLASCITEPDVPEPAALEVVSGNGQIQGRGRNLHEPIVVRALDDIAQPMAGVEIDFGLDPGGGFVEPRSAVTDSTGEVSVTWVLGDVPGPQFLTARARGASVEIAATVRPGDFDIRVVADTLFTPEQEAAIRAAAERWAAVIVGDLPDQPLEEGYVPAHQCEGVEESEIPPGGAVDDVLLAVTLVDDDRIRWGQAICLRRSTEPRHPTIVQMTVHRGALDRIFDPMLEGWTTHIVGHLIGFGWAWGDMLQNPVRLNGAGADTHFPDPPTIAAFDAAGGANWIGSKVPVENQGPNFRRDIHWREPVLGDELMSPYLPESGPLKDLSDLPLSAITVQSMAALGYEVDVAMADRYTVSSPGAQTARAIPYRRFDPWSDLEQGAVEILDKSGRLIGVAYRR